MPSDSRRKISPYASEIYSISSRRGGANRRDGLVGYRKRNGKRPRSRIPCLVRRE
jgi:hypothetical protein